MEPNDLGYFKDYGNWILSLCLILYGVLYTFLYHDLEIEEDDY